MQDSGFIRTTALDKILEMKSRLRVIQGGSSAGKTVATLLILIDIAQSRENILISVVSSVFPHLRRGCIRDFMNIMESQRYFDDKRWNKSESIYTFETGSRIEFFSADQSSKVRGPRRDILFINEANNISYETYTQLAIRTNEIIFIDYNPVTSFWVHEEVIPNNEHDFVILTYKDNEALPDTIKKEIESRQHNKSFWTVFGLGLIGEAEGLVYNGWQQIDEIPHEARLDRYGVDFGYTSDPTAIVAVYYYNGGYILDEIAYTKGLSNKNIADIFKNIPRALVVADSAEPKSIDEIRMYGVNIVGASKGQGSINRGIQYVQSQRISVTKNGTNLWKEYKGYLWQTDKDGRQLNIPSDFNNHAMDSIRYALDSINPNRDTPSMIYNLPKFKPKDSLIGV